MLISLHTIQFWITGPENSMAKYYFVHDDSFFIINLSNYIP